MTRPLSRLAPVELVVTGPRVPRAAASILVVVVFPLVPETRAMVRPAARRTKAPPSTANSTRPPITDPSPAPTRRDSAATARPAPAATRVRRGRAVAMA